VNSQFDGMQGFAVQKAPSFILLDSVYLNACSSRVKVVVQVLPAVVVFEQNYLA